MTVTLAPDELEAIVGSLDADGKAHVGTILLARAAEERRQSTSEGWDTLPDPETVDAFAELEPLADRLIRHAERSRSIGIDDDIIGCNIARELLDLGYSEEETAKLIAEAGIEWHRRTADERLVAAASELLANGLDLEVVRDAFAALGVSQ
jgi:hypothetical protein